MPSRYGLNYGGPGGTHEPRGRNNLQVSLFIISLLHNKLSVISHTTRPARL